MITFQKELFVDIQRELPDLFYPHWEEVALDKAYIFLNPDWDKYLFLEKIGTLHIIAARDNGKLIGYYFGLVQTHLHYAHSLTAHTDIFYLAPPYRKGYIGVKLFTEAERMVRDLRAEKWYVASKLHATPHGRRKTLNVKPIFDHLGFVQAENLYTKLLLPRKE